MKANEAPEKIYLVNDDLSIKREWYKTKQVGFETTEYTRTDAFIEKAYDAYCKVCGHYPHTTPKHICRQACDYYKDFKQAMKDE